MGSHHREKSMTPLKRAANISSSNVIQLRRIYERYDEKASHLNQVLLLGVLRLLRKERKKEWKKKLKKSGWQKWLRFRTSVNRDIKNKRAFTRTLQRGLDGR